MGGIEVDWRRFFEGHSNRRVGLPTYPFQRRHYWLEPAANGGDAAAIGQRASDHPLLGAAISVPGGEQRWLFTGRLSLQTHPWLGDHAFLGTAILPGAGFVELALSAGAQTEAEVVEELAIEAPLVLPVQGAVQVRVSVEEPDDAGLRSIAIYSRAEDSEGDWVRNASGFLAPSAAERHEGVGEWPPAGATPIEADSLYDHAAALGIEYGPAFQGVTAAWRRDEELFAEIALEEEQREEAERFGVHPALLDAAFHAGSLYDLEGDAPKAPFACGGVDLRASGASALRLRIARETPDTMRLTATDPSGEPVLSVRSLTVRQVDPAQLRSRSLSAADFLFAVEWNELSLPAGDAEEAEEAVRRVDCTPPADLDPPAAAAALCERVLAELQGAIAEEGAPTRVAFLTTGAVAAREGESPDPAAASVWGMVGSAQAEHPDRFVLLDSDGSEASGAALSAALAIEDEPQIALRDGVVHVPRLAPAPAPAGETELLGPEGTVLITGGTGALGALFARHLVAEHGVRHLVLTSRRGPDAHGAGELQAELSELGAEVQVVSADVAERPELERLLAAIPAERPPSVVLHCAGTTDDGLIDSLDRERLATTMAPKSTAAWHLHELTKGIEGCQLILFSSIAGTFQSPGQGNYAAANAFLDALARSRRAEGLAGISFAWGLWAARGGSEDGVPIEVDLTRVSRGGIAEMSSEVGLGLFDRGHALGSPALVAAQLDLATLRAMSREQSPPALLRGLVRAPARRAGKDFASLATRLAAVPESEREDLAVELVRSHVAALLGHSSAEAVDPDAAFKDLGFDSLVAVELRNRLAQATGLRLSASLVFDYPTATAVGGFLRSQVEGTETPADTDRKLDSIAEILGSVPGDEKGRALARLQSLLAGLSSEGRNDGGSVLEVDLDSASDEELFELIDGELGSPQ